MKLYLVELEQDDRIIREYEYANSDAGALERVLQRLGTTVTVTQCKPVGKKAELLEAAQRIRDETFNV